VKRADNASRAVYGFIKSQENLVFLPYHNSRSTSQATSTSHSLKVCEYHFFLTIKTLTLEIETKLFISTMLFNVRTALRVLLALGAATAVVGNSFYEDESVEARGYDEDFMSAREFDDDYSLSARGYDDEFSARSIQHSFRARGSVDGGDFVLSARDLGKLGVRAEDVSHVLVLRMNSKLSPEEKKKLTEKIAWWKTQITAIKPKIATALAAKKAAEKEKPKDDKKIKKASNAYSDLVQMKLGYEQEIEETQALLK